MALVVGLLGLVSIFAPTGASAQSCSGKPDAPVISQITRTNNIKWKWDECATNYNIHYADGRFIKSVQRSSQASDHGFHFDARIGTYFVTATRDGIISNRSNVLRVVDDDRCTVRTPAKPARVRQQDIAGKPALMWHFDYCVDQYNIYEVRNNGGNFYGHRISTVFKESDVARYPEFQRGKTYYVVAIQGGRWSDGSDTVDLK